MLKHDTHPSLKEAQVKQNKTKLTNKQTKKRGGSEKKRQDMTKPLNLKTSRLFLTYYSHEKNIARATLRILT